MKTGLENVIYKKKVIVDELHKGHKIKGTHVAEVFTHHTTHKSKNNDEFAILGMDLPLPFEVTNHGFDKTGGERITINQKMAFNVIFHAAGYQIPTTLVAVVKIPTTYSESFKVQNGEFQPVKIPGMVRESDKDFVKHRVEEMMVNNKHLIMKCLPNNIKINLLTERGQFISVLKNKGYVV